MERTCWKCGSPIEDGVPFCPECRAPQIRVNVPEDEPATPPLTPGTPDNIQPPSRPVQFETQISLRDALPGAIASALVAAACWAVPLLTIIVLPAFTGGILAVLFYSRRRPHMQLTGGSGARVGAIAGAASFALMAVLLVANLAATQGGVREAMRSALEQSAQRSSDPRAQEILQRLDSPEFMTVVAAIAVLFLLGLLLACSSLGGAIAGKLLHRREHD